MTENRSAQAAGVGRAEEVNATPKAPLEPIDLSMPVPPETVAVFKYPIPVDTLSGLVKMLEGAYGPGLVIRTDAGVDGWMVVARPTKRLDTDASSVVTEARR